MKDWNKTVSKTKTKSRIDNAAGFTAAVMPSVHQFC
jgi:hypothetical protein